MAKLLLCEDEPTLAEQLVRLLKAQYIVDYSNEGQESLYLALEFDYDLIVLDLGLPGLDGLKVLAGLREQKATPVLVLTARNAWQERVQGLKTGADDYLGKPFHFEELQARIEALLKRPPQQISPCLTFRTFELCERERTLIQHNESDRERRWSLTRNEFILLQAFFQAPGRVFSKAQLLQKLGDQHYDRDENLIEVYIRKVRQYLGKNAIETLRSQGYRLVSP
ncbi:MAG: response regulator transcription factor [Hydrogenovibrio sp.]|uniref:response regulator transcription factor n=1 Tax=Hydrogenovibrio sp. TaxID=2065821 RepID=UPI002870AE78|nr:response regulator transcription factor [Hydrogenovibrio sp.]MDR9500010.1 response regulator transcription factor [Hydrogenovibrio sp.]